MGRRVFLSHSSIDKPAVEAIGRALEARGIEIWIDKDHLKRDSGPQEVVSQIDRGLEKCHAGLVFFSAASRESFWIDAEVTYLTFSRVRERKAVIPVALDDVASVPPLLRALAVVGGGDLEHLIAAIEARGGPLPKTPVSEGDSHDVVVRLARGEADSIDVRLLIDGEEHAHHSSPALPPGVVAGQEAFLSGRLVGQRRGPAEANTQSLERDLTKFGRALGRFVLPDHGGEALMELLQPKVGKSVEVHFEADDSSLLGLPFEVLRLPDDRRPALEPQVLVRRRPINGDGNDTPPLAGPLKILVAVGAPDEGQTASAVLDIERELQNILDAVERVQRSDNVEVRILEVGHPQPIGEAFERDAYHVLHLSCHGRPGALELEDEEGRAVAATAEELLEPIRAAGRPLPLVFLNACHGGTVAQGLTASFAQELLAGGVPAVVAMQTSVSDHYAIELAGKFYEHLARREGARPSRALATARRDLEVERRKAREAGADAASVQPEYATATVYGLGREARLVDFGADREPLRARPVHDMSGPVPQLRLDELIGRRAELRRVLRLLREPTGPAGVVLTGIGGVGKSALAGRAMRRLAESGFLVAAYKGMWDLGSIALAVGAALVKGGAKDQGEQLADLELPDDLRLRLLAGVIAEQPVLLVLDDFEQCLTEGGGAFREGSVSDWLSLLVQNARKGRLLLTSRYPVPGMDDELTTIQLGPLSTAESRKLLQRLPALREHRPDELARVLRWIGGHPRMLEFLDALLNNAEGRLPLVTRKLRETLEKTPGVQLENASEDLSESVRQTVLLGARDVVLEELFALAQQEGLDEYLGQTAVSNLAVDAAGLAHMLADAPADTEAAVLTAKRLRCLSDLSLVFLAEQQRQSGGEAPLTHAWVHRWTAEGLRGLVPTGTWQEWCGRAARYRLWRVQNTTRSLEDAVEALRNYLAGDDFDNAAEMAMACIAALKNFRQLAGVAQLAGEVLLELPQAHRLWPAIADEEAQAHMALGLTQRAADRSEALHATLLARADAEPDRADYQRDLAVSYSKMGDLYRALGQGDKARDAFANALDIAQRLADAEPGRADYQRDLAVSYNKMGDLYRALGQGDTARDAFANALDIAQRLADAEPDRADYQRDLAVSYSKMGDLYRALGQGDKARDAFANALDIAQRLADAEPDRADYQRDLAVSYSNMGDLYRALGQGDKARDAYEKDLAIAQRLADAEPDRADYQRDLAVSYSKMGDLYRALGQGDKARDAFANALDIAQRLADAEPDRADYQRDLAVSYSNMGDLYRALGQGDKARDAYEKDLAIAQRLTDAEPDRADYQRDLAVSFERMGDLYRTLGQGDKARDAFAKSLAIRERLADAEPDRADYQRDLAISFERMATATDEAEQISWIDRAVVIRRRVAEAEPTQALLQRELGIALLQRGQLASSNEDVVAGAVIICELRKQNALEAEYWELAEQLETLLRDNDTGE